MTVLLLIAVMVLAATNGANDNFKGGSHAPRQPHDRLLDPLDLGQQDHLRRRVRLGLSRQDPVNGLHRCRPRASRCGSRRRFRCGCGVGCWHHRRVGGLAWAADLDHARRGRGTDRRRHGGTRRQPQRTRRHCLRLVGDFVGRRSVRGADRRSAALMSRATASTSLRHMIRLPGPTLLSRCDRRQFGTVHCEYKGAPARRVRWLH